MFLVEFGIKILIFFLLNRGRDIYFIRIKIHKPRIRVLLEILMEIHLQLTTLHINDVEMSNPLSLSLYIYIYIHIYISLTLYLYFFHCFALTHSISTSSTVSRSHTLSLLLQLFLAHTLYLYLSLSLFLLFYTVVSLFPVYFFHALSLTIFVPVYVRFFALCFLESYFLLYISVPLSHYLSFFDTRPLNPSLSTLFQQLSPPSPTFISLSFSSFDLYLSPPLFVFNSSPTLLSLSFSFYLSLTIFLPPSLSVSLCLQLSPLHFSHHLSISTPL